MSVRITDTVTADGRKFQKMLKELAEKEVRVGFQHGKATEEDGTDIAPTEYDDDDNPIYGYTVTVPKASDLTEAERKSRKLTGCKWSARLAGAIHAVEISGNLTF